MLQIQSLGIIVEKLKPWRWAQQPVGSPVWRVLSVKQLTVLNFASDRVAPTIGTPAGRWCLCFCDIKIFVFKIAESSQTAFIFSI